MDSAGAMIGFDAQQPTITHDAFVSYSRKDGQFAAALQKALKAYKPPKDLNLPQRYLSVFLDKEDFTGTEYYQSLEKHLKSSGKLILICSPNACKSKFVNPEIEGFLSLHEEHGAENIIPVLFAGTPNNEVKPGQEEEACFPQALMNVLKMPLAVNYKDFRPEKDKITKGVFYDSWYTLLANLYGISRTELEQRDKKRRTRRRIILGAITTGVIAALIIAMISMNKAQERERVAQAQKLAATSKGLADEAPQRSLLLAVEAEQIAETVNEKRVSLAEEALRSAIERTGGQTIWQTTSPITAVAMNPGSNAHWLIAASEDGSIKVWDLSKGEPVGSPLELRGHTKSVRTLAISPDDRWLVTGGDDKTIRRWDLTNGNPEKTMVILSRLEDSLNALAIDSAGRRLVYSVANDTKAYILDMLSKAPQPLLLPHGEPLESLKMSPDGSLLATGGKNGSVYIWDFANLSQGPRSLHGHKGAVKAIAFSKHNRWLITGGKDKLTMLWDLARPITTEFVNSPNNKGSRILLVHPEFVCDVAITPNEKYALSADGSGRIFRWDLTTVVPAERETELFGHKRAVYSLAVSLDSNWLLSASDDNTCRIWSLNELQPANSATILRGHDDRLSAVALSADNIWAATGSHDGTVRLWRLRSPDDNRYPLPQSPSPEILQGNIMQLEGWTQGEDIGQVFTVAISPDNRWFATGGELGPCQQGMCGVTWLWERPSRDLLTRVHVQRLPEARALKPVKSAQFSSDSRWFAAGDEAGELKLWRLDKGTLTKPFHDSHKGPIHGIAFSPDNHWLVSGGGDGFVHLWDLTDPKKPVPRKLSGNKSAVTAVAIALDSHRLVTGYSDGSLRLWDMTHAGPNITSDQLSGHTGPITAMAISPNGRWLATASADKSARIWDLQRVGSTYDSRVLVGHHGPVTAIAIGTDGHWVVTTGSEDNTARLWDLTSVDPNTTVKILKGHEKTVSSVAIAANNSWIVTASYDMTARLWDPSVPDPSAGSMVLRGHNGGINAVAVSNDGRYLLTGGYDYLARLWLLQTKDLVEVASILAGRELTNEERRVYLGKLK
jgi:WD40 repeat protein